jgi:hypothetical protein
MATGAPPTAIVYRWLDGALVPVDYCESSDRTIAAADSWLVEEGRTLALGLHRERFEAAAGEVSEFWDAAVAAVPATGAWFPRVERLVDGGLVFRLRSAPERTDRVVLATHLGPDPRTTPAVKGPDLEAMLRIRTIAQARGAGEAVILAPGGFVVEGAHSALVWWRGSILCHPADDFARVDSITARSLRGLATALGVETWGEAVTPSELDGTEVWALSALHGARIVTGWVDGPELAELPGRLRAWRERLARLRR